MSMPAMKPPIILPAASPPKHPLRSATFIFIHRLGDDAAGLESSREQTSTHAMDFLPNTLENCDTMQTTWSTPTQLSSYPSSRPELDEEEDEAGKKASVAYVVSIIDDLVSQGISLNLVLLTGLTSKYAGKLRVFGEFVGVFAISRLYSPVEGRGHVDNDVENLPARGMADMLVPKRYFRICYESLFRLGLKQEKVLIKENEVMGDVMGGAELRDLCEWREMSQRWSDMKII
ncbi:hypothetical protein K469DRAFT_732192 [Zopfia rhizophila CBS 207.26]|uniref:Uncharacterized protein n=1 Tax=Zopfia rhizophila CBS 207.26 TaxID=1314779 RepID=A0A6A6DEJ5_9PEZI|nr:hypothetical protein K469DRAFT_732192 [Zopfia rhizophila CBS 207.26]